MGRTRATVLCVIADHPACTTTQLARHAHRSGGLLVGQGEFVVAAPPAP
ncbi:hypothetical protein [Streptomyces sp. NBC_01565]|nr:hypothetical protein [Streptomyces sp. NBC_01565]MCX4546365.1 hypothetical protein [Streptomyces sp. NBC_01565]